MPSLLSSLDRCSWTSLVGGEAHIRMVVRLSTLRTALLRCLVPLCLERCCAEAAVWAEDWHKTGAELPHAIAAAPAITPAIEVAGESDVTAALDQTEQNQAISDQIDSIMAKAGNRDSSDAAADDALNQAMPNNYRPPPKQD